MYSLYNDNPIIVIDCRLPAEKKLEACFHELGHHFLHGPIHSSVFYKKKSLLIDRQELEAQAFAIIALIPLNLLKQIEMYPEMENDIPAHLLQQRRELYTLWNA